MTRSGTPRGYPVGAYTLAVPHVFSRQVVNGRANAQPRRKVVLVLEDHASVGGLIAALLRQEGYRAVRAWDREIARAQEEQQLAAARARPVRPRVRDVRRRRVRDVDGRVCRYVVARLQVGEDDRAARNVVADVSVILGR